MRLFCIGDFVQDGSPVVCAFGHGDTRPNRFLLCHQECGVTYPIADGMTLLMFQQEGD